MHRSSIEARLSRLGTVACEPKKERCLATMPKRIAFCSTASPSTCGAFAFCVFLVQSLSQLHSESALISLCAALPAFCAALPRSCSEPQRSSLSPINPRLSPPTPRSFFLPPVSVFFRIPAHSYLTRISHLRLDPIHDHSSISIPTRLGLPTPLFQSATVTTKVTSKSFLPVRNSSRPQQAQRRKTPLSSTLLIDRSRTLVSKASRTLLSFSSS